MKDRIFIAALRLVPKHAASRLAGRVTGWRLPGLLLRPAMRLFARRYRIDLSEAPPLEAYRTFGQFFARPLLAGRRVVAAGDDAIVSPVDGAISETGVAVAGRLVQAKGIDYPIAALLGDRERARRFEGGPYATIYLSPRDYHRIHFPLGGRVTGWRYLPGALWPVNVASVHVVPGLFTVNERLVTFLASPLGEVAIVAVGATVVGRVRASYDLAVPVTDAPGGRAAAGEYPEGIPVVKGEELGAFEMGSTVILCFEPGRAALDPRLLPGAVVRMGQQIGAGLPPGGGGAPA